MRNMLSAAVLAAVSTLGAAAKDAITVEGLVREGYEVKAAFPSNAGPGLVLQKGDAVVMCFVAETKKSADVATQYCKPVPYHFRTGAPARLTGVLQGVWPALPRSLRTREKSIHARGNRPL